MGPFRNKVERIAEEMALRAIEASKAQTDEDMLRQAIIAELDATSLYEQMARSTSNSKIKKVMLSVAKEEKVHVGEFQALLEEIDKEHGPALEDGKKEIG